MHIKHHPDLEPSAGTVNLLAAVWHLGQIKTVGGSRNMRGEQSRRFVSACCTFLFTLKGVDHEYGSRVQQGRRLRFLQTAL